MKEFLHRVRQYARLTCAAIGALRRSPSETLERVTRTLESIDKPAEGAEQPVVDSLPHVVPINARVTRGYGRYLNVMVPGMVLRAMSGGPNTALNLTYRLAREGVPVRYISTDVPPEEDSEVIFGHLEALTGIRDRFDHVEIANGRDPHVAARIGNNDVFLGTAWWTVQMIKHILPETRSRRFLYMIQDFEPGFYPWSTVHALALETYSLDFFGIVNEALLLQHLLRNGIGRFGEPGFSERCISFEPAVDRVKFRAVHTSKPDDEIRRLLFYARPSAPRNLFELGLLALKRAADRGAFASRRWELLFMGDRDLAPARLTPETVVRPLPWLDYNDYARLLRESHVGLALMLSPHTGYPALEMAACGMRVVTNTYSVKSADRLHTISPSITAVEPSADAITDGIVRATAAADSGPARLSGRCEVPSTWGDALEPLLPTVMDMINRCTDRHAVRTI